MNFQLDNQVLVDLNRRFALDNHIRIPAMEAFESGGKVVITELNEIVLEINSPEEFDAYCQERFGHLI